MKDGQLDLSIDRLNKTQDDYYKDIVKVKVTKRSGREGKRREGMVLKILERGFKTLVGTFQKNTSFGFVLPDDRHYDKDIFISKKHMSGAKDGDKVVVRLTDFGGEERNQKERLLKFLDQWMIQLPM